jgi:hypothetical protein
MIRAAMVVLLLLPLGCTVSALPGSENTKLGAGDGGSVDLGPDHGDGGGDHGDGGGCGGGQVDLANGGDGGWWTDGSAGDSFVVDLGNGSDGWFYDGSGGTVDLAY